MTKGKEVPAQVLSLLTAADQRHGFPSGTMASVMQQEVGGNVDQYLADPSKYHYEVGADGRRVAPSTGKVSTAFGPFGLLESTAKDPGYGVKPLGDKASLEEQVRFASDYLAARSKGAGGLAGGLAGYGEGQKYADQVAGRMGVAPTQGGQVPTQVAVAPAQVPNQGQPGMTSPVVVAGAEPMKSSATTSSAGPDPWQEFLRQMPQGQPQQVAAADLNFGGPDGRANYGPIPVAPQRNLTPNFQAFSSWKGRAA